MLVELHPLIVMAHFLLSLLALGVAVVVALGAHDFVRGVVKHPPLAANWLAVVLVPSALALIVTGTLVTAAGPHSGGEKIKRYGLLPDALHLHVGATGIFAIAFVGIVASLLWHRTEARGDLMFAAGVLVLLLVQMTIGDIQWREHLPWPLVLVHVTFATAVVGGCRRRSPPGFCSDRGRYCRRLRSIGSHLRIERRPTLRRAVLVGAFRGWNDGAQGASLATSFLAQAWEARRFAEHRSRGVLRLPGHPSARRARGRDHAPDRLARHGLLPRSHSGSRPRCRAHARHRAQPPVAHLLRRDRGARSGARRGARRHARSAPRRRAAHAPRTRDGLGQRPEARRGARPRASRYEGPTGIVGILHDSCRSADLPSASLWAAVPHYASLAASPRAALALCERLAGLLGTEFDLGDLERASAAYEQQVSEAVSADEETEAYVQELEARRDALGDELDVPSGDSLAAELTRFLREHEARRAEEDEEEDGA